MSRRARDAQTGSAATASRPQPGYDLQAALESLDNDVDLLISQMAFFLNDGPVLVGQIDQAIQEKNSHQLQLAAHRLKGMLARYACRGGSGDWPPHWNRKASSGELDGCRGSWLRQLAPRVARLSAWHPRIHPSATRRARKDTVQERYHLVLTAMTDDD